VVIWSRPLGESGQMTPTLSFGRRRSLIPCTLPVQTVLSVVRGPYSGVAELTEPPSLFFSVPPWLSESDSSLRTQRPPGRRRPEALRARDDGGCVRSPVFR